MLQLASAPCPWRGGGLTAIQSEWSVTRRVQRLANIHLNFRERFRPLNYSLEANKFPAKIKCQKGFQVN